MIRESVSVAVTVTLPAFTGSATVPALEILAVVSESIVLIDTPAASARAKDLESWESGGMLSLADVDETAPAMAAATAVICELFSALTTTAPVTSTSALESQACAPPSIVLYANPAPMPALPP